jgi:hypothetical protein
VLIIDVVMEQYNFSGNQYTDWSNLLNNSPGSFDAPIISMSVDSKENKTKDPNINSNYKVIGEKFIKLWCDTSNNNFAGLDKLCSPNTFFTFIKQDKEYVGFENFKNALQKNGIYKIELKPITTLCQPCDNTKLYINVSGITNIKSNNYLTNVDNKQFFAYFCLDKLKNNKMCVTNYMFILL